MDQGYDIEETKQAKGTGIAKSAIIAMSFEETMGAVQDKEGQRSTPFRQGGIV